MSAEFRLGLIGCGRLAERGYVAAARRTPGVRLVSVADPVRERCERAAPGTPAYDGAEALLAAGGIDGLVLATPAAAHVADAALAASAALPTLIEKPPAVDATQAARLAELDPPPWIGFNRRFEPALASLRAPLSRDGVVDLTLEYRGSRRSWDSYLVHDDAVLALAPHLLDLASWLTGSTIERVRASVLDARLAALELELGGRRRARLACRYDRPHSERIVARDAGGQVVAQRHLGGLRHALARLRRRSESPLVGSLARQLEAFVRAARGGLEPYPATSLDGVSVMAAIDAARRSVASGGSWQAPPLPERSGRSTGARG